MSKKEIEELATQCRTLGWSVENTSKGFYKITPPNGNPIISPGTTNGRALANFKAELRGAGFNPEGAAAAKIERAAVAIAEDRKRNEAALARAERRAQELTTPAPTVPHTPVATLKDPFVRPVAYREAEELSPEFRFTLLSGYPRQTVYITQPQAAFISNELEAFKKQERAEGTHESRQRNLYPVHVAKLQQAMELGEWELNPVDSLVFSKKKRLLNGQHRMKALAQADTEFIETFYPKGVPFEVTTDFPEELAHIFDTNKARSAADALTVDGLAGWGPLAAGALRLVMNYDQSFDPGGVKPWTQWRSVQYTNTELVNAAAGEYRTLLDHTQVASRAYTRSRVTRSATLVAAFLMERDNPKGSPERSNQAFWNGVSGDDDMRPGDPRMALVRHSMRTASKRQADNGPHTLAHILRRYADYQLGKKVEVSQVNRELPMPPVWQPGMRWFGQELRHPRG